MLSIFFRMPIVTCLVQSDPDPFGRPYVKRLTSDFATFWRHKKFTDLNLWCTDGQVAVHKLIFTRESTYLQEILGSSTDLIFPDVTCSVMKKVASLIYYGEIISDDRTREEISSVLKLLQLQVTMPQTIFRTKNKKITSSNY